MFARYHTDHGLPNIYVRWGTSPNWRRPVGLDRDIDVLWIGKRRTKRRSRNIDRIRQRLISAGFVVHVADGVEHPFVDGEERTRLVNRSKVTLNVMQCWCDYSFDVRFHMVAGNRSLVFSALPDAIIHYLQCEDERHRIVENHYDLVATQLTIAAGVSRLMDLAHVIRNGGADLQTSAAYSLRGGS